MKKGEMDAIALIKQDKAYSQKLNKRPSRLKKGWKLRDSLLHKEIWEGPVGWR